MQAPNGIDMDLIREAMERRGLAMPGMPAGQQVTPPTGATPAGGPNSPLPNQVVPAAPAPVAAGQQVPPRDGGAGSPTDQLMKAGQQADSPKFDPDTRDVAKTLVARLLKVL